MRFFIDHPFMAFVTSIGGAALPIILNLTPWLQFICAILGIWIAISTLMGRHRNRVKYEKLEREFQERNKKLH